MQRTNLKMERLIYQWIETELFCARSKFPSSDHSLLALCEEVGELCKAALNFRYTNIQNIPTQSSAQELIECRKEAIQVATMAIRILMEGDNTIGLPPLTGGLYDEDLNDA